MLVLHNTLSVWLIWVEDPSCLLSDLLLLHNMIVLPVYSIATSSYFFTRWEVFPASMTTLEIDMVIEERCCQTRDNGASVEEYI